MKGRGEEELLSAAAGQMSLLSSRRKIWGITGQTALVTGKVMEKPGNLFQTHEGQEGDREPSAQVYRGEIMLNQPDSLLQ